MRSYHLHFREVLQGFISNGYRETLGRDLRQESYEVRQFGTFDDQGLGEGVIRSGDWDLEVVICTQISLVVICTSEGEARSPGCPFPLFLHAPYGFVGHLGCSRRRS